MAEAGSARLIGGLRLHDWSGFAALFCAGGALTSLALGDRVAPLVWGAAALAAGALTRRWSRLYPAPMPYALRWTLHLTHPGLSPPALHRILEPQPGERLLEIGPGIGHHALPTAAVLGTGGRLDVLDVQPRMLADLARRARERGLANVVAAEGDARQLPYPDASFDGAYLVTVLGEIPQPDAALRELRRVLKPGGRIVLGELFLDPDYVSPERLHGLASGAGLRVGRRAGSRFSYFARLEPIWQDAGEEIR
jgi:SAM-dependent methyltransferase